MYRVLIGMPSGGKVYTETMTSLIGAMDFLKAEGIEVKLYCPVGGYTAHNRNKVVKEAQASGATHLMFIDADQTFPPSGILKLLHHDKDIVGANYNTRGWYDEQGRIIATVKPTPVQDGKTEFYEIPKVLFRCFAVGTGFMLIKMSVFDKLKKPYFTAWETPDGDHRTEDVDFCRIAGKKGFDVWCSPSIPVGHIGQKIY